MAPTHWEDIPELYPEKCSLGPILLNQLFK